MEAIHFELFMPGVFRYNTNIWFSSVFVTGAEPRRIKLMSFAWKNGRKKELIADRSDLRFLGIQVESIPSNTVEGDYFHISDADLLSVPSFAVKLGEVYTAMWYMDNNVL